MRKFLFCLSVLLTAVSFYSFSLATSAQTTSTNIEVTGSSKQSSVGRIGVTLAGVELEDTFQRQSKSRGLNPAVFREELIEALKELQPGTIRMEFPNLSQQLADKFSAPSTAASGKSVSGSGYGLGEFLQLCAEAGSDPWLRIPSGTTPEQMRELVEYLSGTGSDAWSVARIASGQSEPWTQVFGNIHVELGNESGSGAAISERMEPGVYAERVNADYGAARQTAGFDGGKFDLMLSGSGVSAKWAAAVLGESREQDSVAIAADLPLRRAGTSQSELYGALLAEPETMDSVGGVVSREIAGLAEVRSTRVNAEWSHLSQAAGGSDLLLAQSWGAGLAQTEHLLQMMAMGVRYQSGTVLTESNLHCKGESQAGNCGGSRFLTEALANGVIGGTMLQTVQTGTNPTWSQVLSGEAVQTHALQSFAFDDGGKISLVVFNLSRTAALPVTLSGNNAPPGDVQMTQIAPSEITDSSESEAELRPSTQTISGSDVSGGLSLPPFSMTVLSWEAGSEGRTAVPAVSSTVKLPSATAKLSTLGTLTALPAASTSTTTSQTIFDCSSGFATTSSSGVCQVTTGSVTGAQNFLIPNGGNPGKLAAPQVNLQPAGTVHFPSSLIWQQQVNVQAFTASFTFIPNGWNLAFILNNVTNIGFNGAQFIGGAGCEGGFYQGENGVAAVPQNVFALNFDQYNNQSGLTAFGYSNAQVYQTGQNPCLPNLGDNTGYYPTNKISTSPVPMNSPVSTWVTTTGHTYSATIVYTGGNLTLSFYDVTAGGSCPGATCFTQTWSGINIPSIVGSNTAWVGLGATTNGSSSQSLYINSFSYTETTPPTSPVVSTYTSAANAGAAYVATPTLSPAPGSYSSAQTVTASSTTPNTYYCYELSATTPTLMPQPNNMGGCTVGTLYSGPITISSSQTLYLMGGLNYTVVGGGLPSNLVVASYTIGGTATATPAFSVAPGTYTTPQTVSISDATSGATIYYTTNGTTPTTSSAVYSGPITVNSTETIEAIAAASGYSNSAIASATYTINSVVPAPTFSPAGGTYTTAQTVTISDSTANTAIYYTTNGTTPTTSSTRYTGPITVSSSMTLEAIAVAVGDANNVGTATFTIAPVLPAPTFSVPAGSYTSAQSVTISDATAGTTIYYTTNGTTPTTSSTVYNGSISVGTSETLKAIAVKTGYTNSAVASAAYTMNTTSIGNPVGGSGSGTTYINNPSGAFSPSAFDLNGGAKVTSAKVLQLTDGGGYESRSAWFKSKLPVQQFTTDFTFQQLDATGDGMTFTIQGEGSTALGVGGGDLGYSGIPNSVAVKFDLFNNSGEGTDSTGLYTDGALPTVPAVDLSSTGIVLRSGDVMHAHLVYDGTNLTMTLTDTVTNATVTEVFPVNIPSLIGGNMAYVGFTGGTGGATATQNVLSWTYSVPSASTSASAVAKPTFSVAAGTYTTAQTVSLSDTISGATIYYTTNGTGPTASSAKYTGAITVGSTQTIKAIAFKAGMTTSPEAQAAYTINSVLPSPKFSVVAGTYTTAQSVSLSDTISGATIYYTTNGTGPTASSAKYTGAITVGSTQTIKAIAFKAGMTTSPEAQAAYTIRTTTALAEAK